MFFRLLLLTILFLSAFSVIAAELFYVEKGVVLKELSFDKDDIKDIFLGRKKFPLIKKKVYSGIYFEDDDQYQKIIEATTGLSLSRYHSLWRRKLFSGVASPPAKIRNKRELNEFIINHEYYFLLTIEKSLASDLKTLPLP